MKEMFKSLPTSDDKPYAPLISHHLLNQVLEYLIKSVYFAGNKRESTKGNDCR